MSIFLFVLILAVLVLSHEFGHFIVAKKFGIRVDEFGFGFPPKIFGKKWGETTYTLNAIPFGGFVKIWGEEAGESEATAEDRERSISAKPKSVQAAVIVAGVAFNILLAWLLLSVGFMVGMPVPGEQENSRTVITQTLPASPAERAGLKPGDTITQLTSSQASALERPTIQAVQEFIQAHKAIPIELAVIRTGGETETVVVTPESASEASSPAIGIQLESIGTLKLGPISAVIEGAKTTALLFSETAQGLFFFVKKLFTAERDLAAVTGPIGIVGLVGNATLFGFSYLLGLTATISINLAVINLIPFPALDGGRLLFIAIEAIKRTPINPKVANRLNAGGFIALLFLMLLITWNDIARLIAG